MDSKNSAANSRLRFFGIVNRRLRWGLSWHGWLLVALAAVTSGYLLLKNIHAFLAVTGPVNTNILVIEGWIHRYALRQGADEFKTGSYQRIFTTGGPENGSGGYTNDYNTSASVGADVLTKKFGLPSNLVQMVPSRVIDRDRTYSSAVALRDWFHERDIQVRSLNVFTEDAHARRTRLLFAKAFGPNVEVGVIAAQNPDYEADHWWRYSEGVEEIMGESIAYLYAKLFFHPPKVGKTK